MFALCTFRPLFYRINRIRLEFKVVHIALAEEAAVVLIESDWNLKMNKDDLKYNAEGY